jgi:two-component system, LuxR family, response regulator FixJ
MSKASAVFIVDDDKALLDSLKTLLGLQGFLPRTFDSAAAFLKMAPGALSGCVLIDVNMPGLGGVELLETLKQSGFGLPCIMMTGFGQVAVAVRAMKAGAFDFIEKPFENGALVALIDRAIEAGQAARERDASASDARTRLSNLTPRELDVLRHLAKGEPNKIIAHELGISPRTVEIHRARLMDKLSASSVADVVRLAITAEILS